MNTRSLEVSVLMFFDAKSRNQNFPESFVSQRQP